MTADTPAAPGTETTETPEIVATARNEASSLIEKAGGLFEQAKEAISEALESTVEAAKENPVAASAIAAGAAAAIAGAAYGASKLLDRDDEDADGSVKG